MSVEVVSTKEFEQLKKEVENLKLIIAGNLQKAEPLMTAAEVCEMMNWTSSTLKYFRNHGKFPFVKMLESYRYRREDIDKWIEERSSN